VNAIIWKQILSLTWLKKKFKKRLVDWYLEVNSFFDMAKKIKEKRLVDRCWHFMLLQACCYIHGGRFNFTEPPKGLDSNCSSKKTRPPPREDSPSQRSDITTKLYKHRNYKTTRWTILKITGLHTPIFVLFIECEIKQLEIDSLSSREENSWLSESCQ